MKTGRNDPCPCGSGKKYKHCCLASEQAAPTDPAELTWRRVRRVLWGFAPRLLEYARARAPRNADPWTTFCREFPAFEALPKDAIEDIYLSWVCFNWTPGTSNSVVAPSGAQAFLDQYGTRLEPLLRDFLETTLRSPYSYCQVRSVGTGGRFEMVDLLDQQVMQVYADHIDEGLSEGAICFGRFVPMGNIAVLESMFGWSLPLESKLAIIDLRAQLTTRNREQRASPEGNAMMLAHLGNWLDDKLRAHEPKLLNRHGEEIDPQVLRYEVDSLPECWRALQDLDPEGPAVVTLAERDYAAGQLPLVRLHWVARDVDSTLLATFDLGAERMRVEVNSRERAERVRALLAERLGERVRPSAADPERFDQPLMNLAKASEAETVFLDHPIEDQLRGRLAVEEYLTQHYERWPEIALPALGGLSPLQAMQDPIGREKVSALIEGIVHGPQLLPPDVHRRLLERLGLDQTAPFP